MRARLLLTLVALPCPGETVGAVPHQLIGSRLALEVEKTGLMSGKTHVFQFERYGGRLDYDEARPENSRVTLRIESASIVCRDAWLSGKDLKKVQVHAENEMLAVKQHPEILFTSTRITKESQTLFEVAGDLTIRGLARPVTVLVEIVPESGGRIGFKGQAVVRLTDYGLKPPSALLGAIGTRDEMRVSFELAAARAQ